MKTFSKSITGITDQLCQDSTRKKETVTPAYKAAQKVLYIPKSARRKQFFGTGERLYAAQFLFILTARFKGVIWKHINMFYEMTFMIDLLRTAHLTAIKELICLMDWVMYQSAFLVCIMNDGDFYFSQTSITFMCCLIVHRSADCCLVSSFLCSLWKIRWQTRRT